MTVPALSLSNISFSVQGRPILDHVSLSLNEGHFIGIVGPNGAGKSTILSIIAGLQQADEGHIDILGQCMNRFNRHKLLKQVGYLHQLHEHEPHLPLTVRDVVSMGLTEFSLPLWRSINAERSIRDALTLMEMEDHIDADFRLLSGGQRQRVRIARALVRNPKILLMDEPSAAMDSKRQQQLYLLLRQLCDENGTTVVMVEHDIAAITSHVDSVACLNQQIHYHAMKGEQIPEDVWHTMYGDHMHVIAHDDACIGCQPTHDTECANP